MNKELERWRELGDAAVENPGLFLILVVRQFFSILWEEIKQGCK